MEDYSQKDYISKDELRRKLDLIQAEHKARTNTVLPLTEISKDMGHYPKYISTMLTDKGKITKPFVLSLEDKYQEILNNQPPILPPMPPKNVSTLSLPGLRPAPFAFEDAESLYHFKGDSMYPKIANGTEIAVKEITDFRVIVSGEVYVIYLQNGLSTVRYINLVPGSKDDLILDAYNDKAGKTPIKMSDIKHLFKILFLMSRI